MHEWYCGTLDFTRVGGKGILFREVSSVHGYLYREKVSLVSLLKCMQEWYRGTQVGGKGILFREVSSVHGYLYRELGSTVFMAHTTTYIPRVVCELWRHGDEPSAIFSPVHPYPSK